ncbi:MAG: D-alanyl-D-alanine carboxypeptidase family protein, partial [Gallionella sp.]
SFFAVTVMKVLALLCLLFSNLSFAAPLPAAPSLTAKAYLLYDYSTRQVLVEKNSDARMEPASLTKLMTAYLAFDAIEHDTIKLDDLLVVPQSAVRNANGESRMLLKFGQSVSVADLLRGLIVQSGNDAAITLAVHIAGSEAGFVEQMNKQAAQLGLRNTHFVNPVGLPDAQHYSSAHDLALIAAAIVHDYPQFYELFSLREFTFNNVTQANRNRLLWLDPNADGMKTGHTDSAGFCLVGSAKRDSRRLISVLLGAPNDALRSSESQQLINYGFQNFDAVSLYKKEQVVTELRIWKGTQSNVEVGFKQDILLSVPKGQLGKLKATLETRQPLLSPIDSSVAIGVMKLSLAGKPYAEFPIYPLENVSAANVFARGWDSIRLLIIKYWPKD